MDITGLGLINPVMQNEFSMSRAEKSPQDFLSILERAKKSEENNHVPGRGGNIDKNDKLYELCLELETFLVKNLLSSMRNTVQKSGLVDDSFAGKMYEDMLWDEYAKDFTKNAGFGMAEQAYRQLKMIG